MAQHLRMAFFENILGLGYTGNGWFLCNSIDVPECRRLAAVSSLECGPVLSACVPKGVHQNTLCAVPSFLSCVDTCGV